MPHLLGIDLGTSSVKAVVIDEQGRVTKTGAHEYPIQSPRPGWAEQDTESWWDATVRAVRQATADTRDSIKAIGLSGQMHGVVLIDTNYQPTGPAIIWADQRSAAEV
ncbi:MAG: xylulokinase, partial [Anaerolineae bacterium]|nr:xylulokinase [Anaerolineae bacterium]